MRKAVENYSPPPWGVNTGHYPVATIGTSNVDGQNYVVCMNGYAARDGQGNSDAKNDAERIVACVNALAGRNPEAVKRLVEAAMFGLGGLLTLESKGFPTASHALNLADALQAFDAEGKPILGDDIIARLRGCL